MGEISEFVFGNSLSSIKQQTPLLILSSMSLLLLSSRQLPTLAVARLGRSYQKPSTSHFSTITDANDDDGLVLSQVDEDSGIAILAMNRPPANSLNLQMYVAYACLYRYT